MPAYARQLASVVPREPPIAGDPRTIDLVAGYSRMNTSPILKLFLSRMDDLIARVFEEDPLKPTRRIESGVCESE